MRAITLTTAFGTTSVNLSDTATAAETRDAIQQMLDMAAAAKGGGTVTLSGGTYVVAAGGTAGDGGLRVGSNTVFEGAGMGLTTIQLADNPGHDVTGVVRTDSGKTNPDGTPTSCHDVLIRNLSIDGNKACGGSANIDGFFSGPKPFTATGIDTNIALDHVEVLNASRYGFDPHERTDKLTFTSCVSHDNVMDGFTIDNCSNVVLDGCEAFNNGRHGFNIVTSSCNVLMQQTLAHDNGASGIVAQTGVYEQRALTNCVTIEGGEVYRNGSDGIVVRQASNVTIGGAGGILGVSVTNNGRFGVLVEGGDGVTIQSSLICDNKGGSGSDNTDVRIRGYLQTYSDSDPLNDLFVQSHAVTITGNTLGTLQGQTHDYGVSYSDTNGFIFDETISSPEVTALTQSPPTSATTLSMATAATTRSMAATATTHSRAALAPTLSSAASATMSMSWATAIRSSRWRRAAMTKFGPRSPPTLSPRLRMSSGSPIPAPVHFPAPATPARTRSKAGAETTSSTAPPAPTPWTAARATTLMS